MPQDDDPNYALVPPDSCGSCHPDQVLDCVDNCPGVDDAVFGDCTEAIPATSEWGLIVLARLLMTIAKLRFSLRFESLR